LYRRKAFCRIVSQDTVDQNDLFMIREPRTSPQRALRTRWGERQIEVADEADNEREDTLELRFVNMQQDHPRLKLLTKNNQNHPGLPATPRISRIPAARSEEMTRATLRVDQKAAKRTLSSFDV
jgi:hypothetical protein